ncbi:uncharacterized protein LOC123314288 [Coccinella septempunctata]|uniref:uncharacterized protein LOC123314288 n=1 Tax=Coccinella septempunctata TaxID=41139 RepID=UPI001D067184|nr:uncharacterized protein LOC123314288 [Coccinella septempunctata]
MSAENPEDSLNKWMSDGSWILCETEETVIKMRKMTNEICDNTEMDHDNPAASTSFEWLDGREDSSLVVPLAEGEQFYVGDYDATIELDTERNEDEVLLQLDFDEEMDDWESNLEDGDNGRVMQLFIVHVFLAEEHKRCLQLGGYIFKTVMIYGTVTEVKVSNKKNSLLIDDGTGQIRCYMEDHINDDVEEVEENSDSSDDDGPFSEMFQYFKEEAKESEYISPTFSKIDVGDRVWVLGNVSAYKDNRYIFIKKLSRPKSINSYIAFMEEIFEEFDQYPYDFVPSIEHS